MGAEMNILKREITELKKEITAQYPNDVGDNWYTKDNVIRILDDLYNLLDIFKSYSDDVDVAFMKSSARQTIKQLTEYLNAQKWVDFCNKLSVLRTTIYQAWLFISIHKELHETQISELQKEIAKLIAERNNLQSELKNYKAQLDNFVQLNTQLNNDQEKFEQLKEEYTNLKQKLEEQYQEWQENFSNVEENSETTNQLYEQIQSLHSEAKKIMSDLRLYDTKIIELFQSAERLDKKAKLTNENIDKSYDDLEKLKEVFEKQKQDIQNIVEDANRASMAGSFKTKVDELTLPLHISECVTYVSLTIVAGVSAWLLFKSGFVSEKGFDLISFLVKLPIVIPLAFIAWLSNKRNAYLFRLREDYAYKYASAMAFEGYKKQVQEHNQEMMEQLLKIALDNLGEKPHRVFDKEIRANPTDELVVTLKDLVQTTKNEVKDVTSTVSEKILPKIKDENTKE